MDVVIILLALGLLILVAYRGFSVIIFAPMAAMLAVVLTFPAMVLPYFSGVFMERMVDFVKLYFPVFLLGAIFGKVVAMSGFAKAITSFTLKTLGPERAIFAIVLVCALLTYGGVSLFVVAFAVYPFGAVLFRDANIPKRLLPATIALGAFTFTMDAFPGSPQIQNIIPTTFFRTDTWAAPWLGFLGGMFVFGTGLLYLQWQKNRADKGGEGYGEAHINEPEESSVKHIISPYLALLPLLVVALTNKLFTYAIPVYYGKTVELIGFGLEDPVDVTRLSAIWAVILALILGIATVMALAFKSVWRNFNAEMNTAVGGALVATLNTASEYGFGAVIAALPGFQSVKGYISNTFNDLLVNLAVTVNVLSAITGSASGGMSIALAAMGDTYLQAAQSLEIPPEVLHRVASMASGGMDTLPHNGAIITLLLVCGLTHKQSYLDIFALTGVKTAGVFFIIALYYALGIV